MATPLSALSTADLVACLEGLGDAYVAYSAELRANGVDGALVATYAEAGNLDELFTDLNITSKLHRSKLRNVFGAVTSPAAKPVIDVFFRGGESPHEKLTKLKNTLADWRKEQPHRMEPYFHYTSCHVAGLILNGGFKPGDVGMAGKGVYLTEQSPAEPVDGASWPSPQFRAQMLWANYGKAWADPDRATLLDAVLVCFVDVEEVKDVEHERLSRAFIFSLYSFVLVIGLSFFHETFTSPISTIVTLALVVPMSGLGALRSPLLLGQLLQITDADLLRALPILACCGLRVQEDDELDSSAEEDKEPEEPGSIDVGSDTESEYAGGEGMR